MSLSNINPINTYIELIDGYALKETPSKTTGTRSFLAAPVGTDSLPTLDEDFFDNDHQNCLCREIDFKIRYPDPNDRTKWDRIAVCSYSTSPSDTQIIYPDLEERRFSLGGEIITVDNPVSWTWELSSGAVNQPLFLSNIMGSFTRQVRHDSKGAKDSWIQNRLIGQGGTINDSTFEGFREGSVLFSGVNGGTQQDNNGNQFWLFECEFTYRIIRGAGGLDYDGSEIDSDDWLYLWNKDAGTDGSWDKPENDGVFLYDKTSFEQIF